MGSKNGRIDFNGIDVTREDDLSVAEIKACPIFAHLTDEQALEVIETIKKIADIAFECSPKTLKKF